MGDAQDIITSPQCILKIKQSYKSLQSIQLQLNISRIYEKLKAFSTADEVLNNDKDFLVCFN